MAALERARAGRLASVGAGDGAERRGVDAHCGGGTAHRGDQRAADCTVTACTIKTLMIKPAFALTVDRADGLS